MLFKKRFIIFILSVLNDHSSLIIIFINVINSFDNDEKKNEEKKSFKTFISNILHISISKSNVFQASRFFFKRLKIKISHIHKHINTRNDYFVCNRKIYILSSIL